MYLHTCVQAAEVMTGTTTEITTTAAAIHQPQQTRRRAVVPAQQRLLLPLLAMQLLPPRPPTWQEMETITATVFICSSYPFHLGPAHTHDISNYCSDTHKQGSLGLDV